MTAKTSTGDREELRGALRAWFAKEQPESAVRALMAEPGLGDRAVWDGLTATFDVPGLLIPEEHGGGGLSLAEAAVVLEETGRAVATPPVLTSAVVATTALLHSGATAHLAELAAGRTATLAYAGDVTAEGGALTGTAAAVPVGELVLVAASGGLYAVPWDGAGVTAEPLEGIDLTRRNARLTFAGAPAERLSADFADGLAATLGTAAVAASAEALGAAERALEIAAEYALQRHQFGVPIGSFQAVKHLLADAKVRTEQMRGCVETAAEGEITSELAAVTKAYCSDGATRVVEIAIQVVGGIGFTWEHPLNLLLRRIKGLEFAYGNAAAHRRRLAVELGLAV